MTTSQGSPDIRAEYLYALKQYVAKAFALSEAWEHVSQDMELSEAIDLTSFPFAMSFDEYCHEMLRILEKLEEAVS